MLRFDASNIHKLYCWFELYRWFSFGILQCLDYKIDSLIFIGGHLNGLFHNGLIETHGQQLGEKHFVFVFWLHINTNKILVSVFEMVFENLICSMLY
jgi:hypothetical protein